MASDKTSRLKRKLLRNPKARKALRRAGKGNKQQVTIDGRSYSVERIDVFERSGSGETDDS